MSNLYKRAFISAQDNGSVVIDANEIFERRLEEKRQKEELRRQSAIIHGSEADVSDAGFDELDPDQLAQLTGERILPDEMIPGDGSFHEGLDAPDVSAEPEMPAVDPDAARIALEQIQEQADQLIADAQAQAEEIKNNAFSQGHDAGYQAGYQEAVAAKAAQDAEFEQLKKELEESYRAMADAFEPEMVETLTRIYEHVFNVRFAEDKNVILHLIEQTLSRTEPTGDFLIHVSGADYETLIDAKDSLRAAIPNPNCNLEIVEDTFLKENECMIETDGGVFDCGLGTELSELSKKLQLLSWSGRDL